MARITIADIATALDLSPTTVSFVLNGREMGISAETRDRVLQKAHELNYSRVSRAVVTGWNRVAYLDENPASLSQHTTFFSNVFNNLRDLAFEKRIEPLMYEFKADQDPESAHQRLEMFKNLDIRVFLTNSAKIADSLVRSKHKVILIQAGSAVEGCTCVYCDDYNAGALAAKHFFEFGHRIAGTVFPKNCNSPRFDGFTETFLNLGGECPDAFEWGIDSNNLEAALKLQRSFMKTTEMPTAIYCFADNYMYPVIRALHMTGKRIPDDVSLIGSDMLYWGQIATPAFSTVDLQERLFAEKVLDAIDDMLQDKPVYQMAIPVKMVPGETVKDLRKS